MIKIYRLFILFFIFSGILYSQDRPEIPWETGQSKGEDLQVMLITISPGDFLTDWWGHVGLAISDTVRSVTRVYNFGLFGFNEGFIERFVMGRLIFWAGDASLGRVAFVYKRANRTINFRILNIENEKKLILANKLAASILPENSHYLYHHYDDNCATRLRDLIDEAVGGQFKVQTDTAARLTYRQHTLRYSAQNVLMQWLLMFLMNDSIDRPIKQWDEMFLPDELAKYVDQTFVKDSTNTSTPLVKSMGTIFDSKRESVPFEATNWPLWTIISGIVIGFLAVLLVEFEKKGAAVYRIAFTSFNLVVSGVIGFVGLVLFLMGLFTDHTVTYNNENLFLANPITLLVFKVSFFSLFKHSKKLNRVILKSWIVLAILSVVLVFLKIFPLFNQDNLMIISLLLPINIGFAVAWFRKEDNHFI